MTITLCAVPYSYDVPFFYFNDKEDFEKKYNENFEKYHCEEYEFQYIDGDDFLDILWDCFGDENVMKLLEVIEESLIDNEEDAIKLQVCRKYLGMSIEDSLDSFEDIYVYHGSVQDYAEEVFDWDSIPEYLHSYVDIEKYARDLVYGGEVTEMDNGYLYIR